MKSRLIITPETKVGELLDAYPEVEDVLIAKVPTFKKLKNPILRRTVAKVATLAQAAQVAGMKVPELVMMIREAVGEHSCADTAAGLSGAAAPADEPQPEWVSAGRVTVRIDADQMIESGEHPIGKVRMQAASLHPGELLCLTSSFMPAPLIQLLTSSGFQAHSSQVSPGRFETYITTSAGG